jgi:choice-of-anchor A domain-containing protein
MSTLKSISVAAAALLTTAALPAHAASLTAMQILEQFNGVVWNNFSTQSDVEGRLVANNVIGGATFYNNPNAAAAASSFQALNAINLTTCQSCNLNNGGSANWVSTLGGNVHFNYNGGGSLKNGVPTFAISDFTTPLNAFVAGLTNLGSTHALSTIDASDNNQVNFKVSADANGVAVFKLTDTQLAGYAGIKFSDLTSAKTIIVDVTSTGINPSFTQNFNDLTSNTTYENEHVIWNFETEKTISIKYLHGALLGEDASVTSGSPIEGLLYAKNFSGNGELHNYPFLGVNPIQSVAGVPEPATWALLGMGFAGLGFASRRARKSAAA